MTSSYFGYIFKNSRPKESHVYRYQGLGSELTFLRDTVPSRNTSPISA